MHGCSSRGNTASLSGLASWCTVTTAGVNGRLYRQLDCRGSAVPESRTYSWEILLPCPQEASCCGASHPGGRLLEPHSKLCLQVCQPELLARLARVACALPTTPELYRNQIAEVSAGWRTEGIRTTLLSDSDCSIAGGGTGPEPSKEPMLRVKISSCAHPSLLHSRLCPTTPLCAPELPMPKQRNAAN